MKKIIILIFAAFTAASCSYLDIAPESAWSSNNYFTSESQLRSGLAGAYDHLQTIFSVDFIAYGDMRGELYVRQRTDAATIERVITNNLTSDLSYASWSKFYRTIQHANLVIHHSDRLFKEGVITQSVVNDCKGQALCMRALTYFWIVRIWGDAPLITEPYLTATQGGFDRTRTPQAEIFAQIHKDLQGARDLLPTNAASKVYLSEPAAFHIDAQVYAWEHNWSKVLECTQAILKSTDPAIPFASTTYGLVKLYDAALNPGAADFTTIVLPTLDFVKMFNEGNSRESIFEVAYSVQDNETNDGMYGMFVNNRMVSPRTEFYESYTNTSTVKDFRQYATFGATGDRINKFGFGYTVEQSARNVVVLRYAEAGLLRAEALFQLAYDEASGLEAETVTAYKQEAVAILNALRIRAGGDGLKHADNIYTGWTKEDALLAVLEERKLELAGEGHRYMDLVRFRMVERFLEAVNGQKDNPLNYVWPIALSEIRDSNGLIEQNQYYK